MIWSEIDNLIKKLKREKSEFLSNIMYLFDLEKLINYYEKQYQDNQDTTLKTLQSLFDKIK